MRAKRLVQLYRLCVVVLCVVLWGWPGAGRDCSAVSLSYPGRLQVMSFNIRYGTANDGPNRWENRRDMVFELLRQYRPDVVGLQEALQFQLEQICQALPMYHVVGVGRDDGKSKGEYCAILYRADRLELAQSRTFWLSDTPEVPGSITWGNACTRICTWARLVDKGTGSSFYLYNLHLDHVSQRSREYSAILVARRVAGRDRPDPYILTGDFNAGEDNPVIKYLKGQTTLVGPDGLRSHCPIVLADSFRFVHPCAREVGTFNGFKGDRSGPKIDFILVRPDLMVLDASIVHDNVAGRYPSDHFPVTARLRLPSSAGPARP